MPPLELLTQAKASEEHTPRRAPHKI